MCVSVCAHVRVRACTSHPGCSESVTGHAHVCILMRTRLRRCSVLRTALGCVFLRPEMTSNAWVMFWANRLVEGPGRIVQALPWCTSVSSLFVHVGGGSGRQGGTGVQEGTKKQKSRYSLQSNLWSQEIANKDTRETSRLGLKSPATTPCSLPLLWLRQHLSTVRSFEYSWEPELGWALGG